MGGDPSSLGSAPTALVLVLILVAGVYVSGDPSSLGSALAALIYIYIYIILGILARGGTCGWGRQFGFRLIRRLPLSF